MRLGVLCPHFAPDVAPTGDVITRIVEELAGRGHHLEVVTALPWYLHHRVEPGWGGRPVRSEVTPWGRVTRVHPIPTDKTDIARRAAAFVAFSALVGVAGVMGARRGRLDGMLAMSPPLTLGAAGWVSARARRAPLVFNIQDVFPDVAVELDVLGNARVVAVAQRLERWSYAHADAITVLSDDLRDNVAAKVALADVDKVRVIPNFVDTAAITPGPKENAYRRQLGMEGKTVVMYAGNVGWSQSLELMLAAARAMAGDPSVVFVINGGGVARPSLERQAAGMANVRFADLQPRGRLVEVLAAADVHAVPLRRGLARSSVPSKTYSILAAGRPLVASVDPGTEVARVVERSGAGLAVPPDDPAAFIAAVRHLTAHPAQAEACGQAGRRWVETWASPAAVAEAYEALFAELAGRPTHHSTVTS